MSFNLINEAWIPVLYHNGITKRVGIHKALKDAGAIRQIAASNPMDRVAVLRFLLAVLYWCKGNPPEMIPDDSFPSDWFMKLDNINNKNCFNLLGAGKRFYQHKSCDGTYGKLSVNYLVQEVPTGTNFWHFRHSTDERDGLCLACCATGLLRLPLFSTSGGRGKPPGVNQKPPIYAILLGSSLAETLLLSWRKVSDLGTPAWEKPDLQLPKESEIPLLTGLTWLPRHVWLDNPEEPEANCISCGSKESLIRQCVFAGIGSTQPITEAELDNFHYDEKPPKSLEKKVRYDNSKKLLTLKGNLNKKEKSKLLALSRDKQYQKAINKLYDSQLHREWRDPHVLCDHEDVLEPIDALGTSDAAADQWAKIMAGILGGQKADDKRTWWVVGFATVKNDKYLEAMEYIIPLPSAPAQIQESIEKIEKWQKEGNSLVKKMGSLDKKASSRKYVEIPPMIASIRPHVESRVSARAGELAASGDEAWQQAAQEYRPMTAAVAKSLSPGFTTAAVKRRKRIARVMPNMWLKKKR